MASAKTVSKLREMADTAIRKQRFGKALEAYDKLIQAEPGEPRWPHRKGDLLNRLGKKAEAIVAFEQAVAGYARLGFIARAAAMAKVILGIDPSRTDVLAGVDPEQARRLHREQRPGVAHRGGPDEPPSIQMQALRLQPAIDAAEDELRFSDAPPSLDEELDLCIDIELSDEEILTRPPPALAASPAPAAASARVAPPPPPRPRETMELELEEFELEELEPEAFEPEAFELEALEPEPGHTLALDADAADAGPAPLDPEDALILEEIELDELRPSPERLAALPSLPLFAEVPPEALKVLLLDSKLLALHDGDRLLRRDDPADTLYSIVEGRVRVEVPGLDPDKPIVLSEGEVVGESCLLDDATRGADVVAHGPVRVLAIPKTVLDAIVAVHPGVGDVLLDLLSRRLLANLLRRSPLFAGFDGSTRRELARLFEIRRADEGTALLLEGKRSDGLFVTLVGQVQISGSAEPTRSVGPGHMLGQGSLITRQPSPATCRALTEILVLRLPASRFNELAAHFPPVLAHLAELASRDDGVVQPIL